MDAKEKIRMTRNRDQQLEMYRRMQRIRQFEQAVQDNNIAGHLSIGQEAAIVGACMALRNDDAITGTHRSHGHPIGKGAALKPLMAELMGKTTGICKGRGGSMHLADASIGSIGESAIVGGGIPLATGAGLSAQVRGTDQVGLCFFGDGASNQGTFHESINMAAVWKLPVIYFCENNLYAISTSVTKSHGQPDIAKRAEAYGIPGVVVDGQNATAVFDVTCAAVARARRGEGPTLIEAKTYRFDEHASGLTMPIPYRSETEIRDNKVNRDPLVLYKTFLLSTSDIDDEELLSIEKDIAREVAEAVSFAQESPYPDPSDVYADMFSNPINYPCHYSGKPPGNPKQTSQEPKQ
jgi:pyruvate dehydrogenase E1 component alpha subunit